MKKLLFLFIVIWFASCSKDVAVMDYRFSPKLEVIMGDVYETKGNDIETYINSPLTLSLSIQANDKVLALEHVVSFSVLQGTGKIQHTDESDIGLNTNLNYKFKDGALNFILMPTSSGVFKLTIKINNKQITENISFEIFVREPSYAVSFSNLPEKMFLEKKFSFSLDIIEISDDEENPTRSVEAVGKVAKGAGDIYISDQIIAENGTINSIKTGSNIISYNAKELDENVLIFEIADKYGTFQKFPVSFKIINPEFNISIKQDEEIQLTVGNDHSFTINIDNLEHPTNKFEISYRFIKGSGIISFNGKKIDTGSKSPAVVGSNIFILNTSNAGDLEIEMFVTDKFDTQKAVIFKSTAIYSDLKVVIETPEQKVAINEYVTFSADVSQAYYNDKFFCSYRFITGAGDITINGKDEKEGVKTNINAGTNNFRYTPTLLGEAELELTFSDVRSQEKKHNIKYTVISNELEFISTSPENTIIGLPASFTLTANEQNYKDKFTVTYTPMLGNGVLRNGTTEIRANTSFTLNNDMPLTLNYAPATIGENKIQFIAKDIYDKTKSISVIIIGEVAPLSIVATTPTPSNAQVGKDVIFKINLTEEGYNDNFTLKYESNFISDEVVINNFLTKQSEDILVSKQSDIKFTSKKAGVHNLTFIVKDKYEQEKSTGVTINTTPAPLVVTASAPNPTNIRVEEGSTSFTIKIDEDYYTDSFSLKASDGDGNGRILYKYDNIANSTINVNNGTHTFSYIGTKIGKHSIMFEVTDIYNQTKSVTIPITVGPTNIVASVSEKISVNAFEYSNIRLNVSEASYSGQFNVKAEIIGGKGTLRAKGLIYQPGTGGSFYVDNGITDIGFCALSGGTPSIKFTITDSYNQTTIVTTYITNIVPMTINLIAYMRIDSKWDYVTTSGGGRYQDYSIYNFNCWLEADRGFPISEEISITAIVPFHEQKTITGEKENKSETVITKVKINEKSFKSTEVVLLSKLPVYQHYSAVSGGGYAPRFIAGYSFGHWARATTFAAFNVQALVQYNNEKTIKYIITTEEYY